MTLFKSPCTLFSQLKLDIPTAKLVQVNFQPKTRSKIRGVFGRQNPEKIQNFNFFKMETRPTSDFLLG